MDFKVKIWLQKQRCSCIRITVVAEADKELQEPIHDYWSQDVTAGAMMWLQEQDVASGVKMLLEEIPNLSFFLQIHGLLEPL